MKAIVQDVYGSPEVLELRDIAQPVPDNGQVLIRVHGSHPWPGSCGCCGGCWRRCHAPRPR